MTAGIIGVIGLGVQQVRKLGEKVSELAEAVAGHKGSTDAKLVAHDHRLARLEANRS